MLIAAASARALAASARRGGYAPLVVDWFGDVDTVAAADAHVSLASGLDDGFDADALLGALDGLAASHAPDGIVCGTGFEDRPDLLAAIARRHRLVGNAPEVVARVKDPLWFAQLCRDHDVPHPETTLYAPADPAGWLTKRRGGAGGSHIRPARSGEPAGGTTYYQRRAAGTPVSALLLADGRTAIVLGFSAQWASPTPRQLFRYGGAVRPAPIAAEVAAAATAALRSVMVDLPLVGLNSADLLVDGTAFTLLEINPRPGATLDIFEPPGGSLFALHVAACRGRLPADAPALVGAAASALVHADRDIAAVPAITWPDWTADRPHAGTRIRAGAPACTVLADAADPDTARTLAIHRATSILRRLHGGGP